MSVDNQNLLNLLNQDGKKQLIEKYMRKELLLTPKYEGVFANTQYGMALGIPTRSGQYMRLTQTKGLRRTSKMLNPTGPGSDPASPAKTGINDLEVPLEWFHEYVEIAATLQETSWLDFKNILKSGMSEALRLSIHMETQNAMFVGRYQPGQYNAAGDVSVAFDTVVEASNVDILGNGNNFTFKTAPRYYAGGAASRAAMIAAGSKARFTDIFNIALKLKLSKAPMINGKYVCILSRSMMVDMLLDPELDQRIAAAITASSNKAREGFEKGWMGEWDQVMFIEDDLPFTEDSGGDEHVRSEWGDVHGCVVFGGGAWGKLSLGSQNVANMPTPKIQDISKIGHSVSMGYLVPGQVAVINSNWCATYKAMVSTTKPNNYKVGNEQLPFGGETLGD